MTYIMHQSRKSQLLNIVLWNKTYRIKNMPIIIFFP